MVGSKKGQTVMANGILNPNEASHMGSFKLQFGIPEHYWYVFGESALGGGKVDPNRLEFAFLGLLQFVNSLDCNGDVAACMFGEYFKDILRINFREFALRTNPDLHIPGRCLNDLPTSDGHLAEHERERRSGDGSAVCEYEQLGGSSLN